jgi:hypothetical protein
VHLGEHKLLTANTPKQDHSRHSADFRLLAQAREHLLVHFNFEMHYTSHAAAWLAAAQA